ncbi:MAG: hypothetical protein P4L74_02800, partial [Candidatus Doudnabacteria bacterium]|nr:hypothetical protein [Candidatus Doudnabacteria bacterium]
MPKNKTVSGYHLTLFILSFNLGLLLPAAVLAVNINASSLLGHVDGSGNPIYTAAGPNNGANSSGFNSPFDAALDTAGHRLFVADQNNNRILVYSLDSNNNISGKTAANVLGQLDFNSFIATTTSSGVSGPKGVAFDSTNNRLFVSDTANNRVLVYNTASISNGQAASHVLGQADFISGSA